ncbi:MAG: response regulator [Nitrospirae bacterium]|nr:response regulator [Nitrospirota bacterium]
MNNQNNELKAAEAEIARLQTECENLQQQLVKSQRLESFGNLTAGIAHDFNNLLGGILGYASFAKTMVEDNTRLLKAITAIEATALRAGSLTRQLLGMLRGDKYEVKPAEVNEIVMEVVRLLGRTLEKNIAIETDLYEELPIIEIDEGQIQQVILNICVNARDAMPDGGRLSIKTGFFDMDDEFCRNHRGSKPGRYLVIAIADTGTGMSAETMEKIFEPFFTTKSASRGTGLGLSMVWCIVKNHGGYVDVISEAGKGSTFHIYLPRPGMSSGTKQIETVAEINREARRGHETLFIIDDENIMLEMLKNALSDYGYRVIAYADGEAGTNHYRKHHREIDMAIIDLMMPGMNGKEAARIIQGVNPDAKILLITGYAVDEVILEDIRPNIRGLLRKPFKIDELCAEIRRILDEP